MHSRAGCPRSASAAGDHPAATLASRRTGVAAASNRRCLPASWKRLRLEPGRVSRCVYSRPEPGLCSDEGGEPLTLPGSVATQPICRHLAPAPSADGLEPIPTVSKNVINVRLPPYNAKGDGQSDDTDAIQAALAAAGSAGGGVVYLPAGTYVFRRPVTVRKSGVIIRGQGRGRTTIRIPVSLSDVYKGTWVQDPKTGGLLLPPCLLYCCLLACSRFRGGGWVERTELANRGSLPRPQKA